MRYRRMVLWAAAVGLLAAAAIPGGEPADPYAGETKEARDARLRWWREARFGLFIHWGVYSVPAGIHDGKKVDGIGEWIMHSARIPVSRYREYARQFNPVKYDPDAWVRLAKDAGMKYIVITSKHHDGFALFETKASKWNVVDSTPYGKDLLKPLAEACRRHGLKLGFYYSQAQDWNNPGGAAFGGHWDRAQDGSMDAYLRDVAVPQVREILSNYGPLGVLWWDTPADMTKERAEILLPLLKLQPGIIHNNRLGGGYGGDTETPEQFIPPTGFPGGRDWETCMTMNDTWGYKSQDQAWKPVEVLVRNLIDIASKGGNYLLNVGPTSEGLIPDPSVERLRTIGKWMAVNGEAIHGTSASPFRRLPWGRCTRKEMPGGTTILYLHVFDWPGDGRLVVPGLRSVARKAWLLAAPSVEVAASAGPEGLVLRVPAEAPDRISSTVAVEIDGAPVVENPVLTQRPDGSIVLPAAEAALHGEGIRYETGPERDNIGFWLDPRDWVEWEFRVDRPGSFDLTATIAAVGSGSFRIGLGGKEVPGKAPATGNYGKFEKVKLGRIEIPAAGKTSLSVKAVAEGWQPFNLKAVEMRRVDG